MLADFLASKLLCRPSFIQAEFKCRPSFIQVEFYMYSFIKKSSDAYGRILVRAKFCESGVSCMLFGILGIYMGEVSYDRIYFEPDFSKKKKIGGGGLWGRGNYVGTDVSALNGL